MTRSNREVAKFFAFLGILCLVLAANELGLDWFYAGFFFGVVVGGVFFNGSR